MLLSRSRSGALISEQSIISLASDSQPSMIYVTQVDGECDTMTQLSTMPAGMPILS